MSVKKLKKPELIGLAKNYGLPTEVDGKELNKAELVELIESYEAKQAEKIEVVPEPEQAPSDVSDPNESGDEQKQVLGDTAWTQAQNVKLRRQIQEVRARYNETITKGAAKINALEKENGKLRRENGKLRSEVETLKAATSKK